MKGPKHSHHSVHHLDELSSCHLDSLGVSLNPDQAASLGVLGDSYGHFVLLLDPIDWSEEREREDGTDGRDRETGRKRSECCNFRKNHSFAILKCCGRQKLQIEHRGPHEKQPNQIEMLYCETAWRQKLFWHVSDSAEKRHNRIVTERD